MKKETTEDRKATKGYYRMVAAINHLGGLRAVAKHFGLTYQSVRGWVARGVPRTEWTGETKYAEKIEKMTKGMFTKEQLLDRGKATKADIQAHNRELAKPKSWHHQ